MESNNMIRVSKEIFWKFVKDNSVKEIEGEFINHSSYFLNKDNNKIAFYQSNVIGDIIEYKILKEGNENYDNYETFNYICNIINKKL